MSIYLDKTYDYLTLMGKKLKREIRAILVQKKRNASHRLSNSIDYDIFQSKKGIGFIIEYAEHGNFVLTHKRNVKKSKPSQSAVDSIMEWILAKGIAIGKGKIRTPMKDSNKKYTPSSKAYSKSDERKKMAWGIWMNIKKNRRTKVEGTNFLSPYNNLLKSKDFSRGLSQALSQDGLTFIGKDLKGEIKIKM